MVFFVVVFCGGVFVAVFLWWCVCSGVFVVVWWCFCRGVLCGGVLWWCFCGCVFVVDNNNNNNSNNNNNNSNSNNSSNNNNNSPPTPSPFHPFNSPTSLYHFSTRCLLPKFCISGKLLTCGVIRSYNCGGVCCGGVLCFCGGGGGCGVFVVV